MRSRMMISSALAAALGVGGCGGGGGGSNAAETGAKQTAAQVKQAAASGEATKLCNDLFTPSLRAALKTLSGKPCETIVKAKVAPALSSLRVKNVAVNKSATLALVSIADRSGTNDKLYLVKSGGGWRVNALFEPGIGKLKVPPSTGTTTNGK